jgi:hypothetical protein
MSTRNQVRTALKLLSMTTGGLLAKEVREVIATFDQPEVQNEPAFATADGQWLTVAQVKQIFGPNYATNKTFLEQCIGAYAGRLINKTIEQVGLDVRVLTPAQLAAVFHSTTQAEEDALVRMTAN